MRTLKIEKEVTKDDVYVMADTPGKLTEVERILAKTDLRYLGSEFSDSSCVVIDGDTWYRTISFAINRRRTEITIPQLAELLGVEYLLKQLPTLEELISEAKSKITVKSKTYPCWVDGSKEVTTYMCAGLEYYSERAAIASYISRKIQEEYL